MYFGKSCPSPLLVLLIFTILDNHFFKISLVECFSVAREESNKADLILGISTSECSSVNAWHNGKGGCKCNYGGTFYSSTDGQSKCYADLGKMAGKS